MVEISQDEREQITEEEKRKILKELRKKNMPPIVVMTPVGA